jgi:hypothetical protein
MLHVRTDTAEATSLTKASTVKHKFDTMYPIQNTVLFTLAALATCTAAKSCATFGACVTYGDVCNGAELPNGYTPTCTGNCFQYDSFGAIQVWGNDFLGTDCHVYSDDNCQNQILDTGNQVFTGSCHTLDPVGKSMKCFYNC